MRTEMKTWIMDETFFVLSYSETDYQLSAFNFLMHCYGAFHIQRDLLENVQLESRRCLVYYPPYQSLAGVAE